MGDQMSETVSQLREVIMYLGKRLIEMSIRPIDWASFVLELDTTTKTTSLDMITGTQALWRASVDALLEGTQGKYVSCHVIAGQATASRVTLTLHFCRASSPYLTLNRDRCTKTLKL